MIKFLLYISNLRGVIEMKEVIKTIAAVSVFALLASCQMNTADDGNQNETQPSVNTTEYTVSFDFTDFLLLRKSLHSTNILLQ